MTASIHQLRPANARPADPPPDTLVYEAEIVLYRPCLALGLLRGARKAGLIAWTRGKRGSAWYTLADIDAFLETRKMPICHAQNPIPCSNSAASGSRLTLNPELEEHVARALARQI